MARQVVDGFETGVVGPEYVLLNYGTMTNAFDIGGGGTYCLTGKGANVWTAYRSVPSKTAYYVAFRYYLGGNASSTLRGFAFVNGSTVLGSFQFNETAPFTWKIYSGDSGGGGTLLGTSISNPSYNTPYLIEMYYLPSSTSGTFILKVNGVEEINVTGVATSPTTASIDKIYIGGSNNQTNYYDNLILDDADWVGNTKIQPLIASGAGNYTQWTPTTGSNYTCIDETPPSDTDYVYTNTANNIDSYTLSALSGNIDSIKSVLVNARIEAVGTPTPTQIATLIRTNSTDYEGTSVTVPNTDYLQISTLYEQNPDTTAAWTTSDIGSLEIGIKAIT